MSAAPTEAVLGVSARYAEQIRELIETRTRERALAQEEAARQAALADERAQQLADASRRATEQAIRIDLRTAAQPAQAVTAPVALKEPAPVRATQTLPAPLIAASTPRPAPSPLPTLPPASRVGPGSLIDEQV